MVSNDMEVRRGTELGPGAKCLKVSQSMAAEPTNQCWQFEAEDQTQQLGMDGGKRQTGDIYACLHYSLRHRCRCIDTDSKMEILPRRLPECVVRKWISEIKTNTPNWVQEADGSWRPNFQTNTIEIWPQLGYEHIWEIKNIMLYAGMP